MKFESGLRTINRRQQTSFFVPEISVTQGFRYFSNLHQLTDAGTATAAGISRLDNVCTHTKPLKGYSSWLWVMWRFVRLSLKQKPIRKGIKHEWKLRAAFCGHGFRAMACRSLIESGLWPRDAVERQMLQWGADYLDVNRNEATLPHLYVKINESLAWLNINSPSDINQSNGCLYPCCALYRQRHYNRQETFLLKGGVL